MRKPRRHLFVALVATAAIALLAPAQAQSSAVAIARINGQDVSDGVADQPITESTLTVEGGMRTGAPVIAEAGSSSAVPAGEPARVLGVALRGQPPYAFAWSFDGAADRFGSPSEQGSSFDTTGLAGEKTLSLTVTDALGESATDQVKVFVQTPITQILLDVDDTSPGGVPDEDLAIGGTDGGDRAHSFVVPSHASELTVSLGWTNDANDFDLRLRDPSGREDGRTDGASALANPETIVAQNPAPGRWVAEAHAWLAAPDDIHLLAIVTGVTPDPAPQLDAGGPYRFIEHESHQLRATVVGGADPVSVTWDLDGDGDADAAGTAISGQFPLGLTLVTAKARDAAGYEKREVVPVRVAERWDYEGDVAPLVVVAVADSGVNVYHREFRAETYSDPRVLALTENFTRHPSEYLPGYPADAGRVDLTLTDEFHPDADKVVDENDGRTTLAEVEEKKLYWIPGTKIIGAYDAGEAAFINSTAGDEVPLLDEDGHGTGSASVAVGNIYGFCPTCLLVMTESADEAWQYGTSWIDIASNSFGSVANVSGTSEPAFPRVSAERGQIALYAAGNGNENAFVTPMQTYLSSGLGPAWTLRVGAAERGSRKPILGTGKPVDVASWGSGDIPAADFASVDGTGSHSGTSAATPYTAGVIGTVLGQARERLGDQRAGQRPQIGPGVVGAGARVASSPFLADGVLTRTELVQAVLKTAAHDDGASMSVFPTTTPNNERQYLVEGYGIVEPASGERAVEVLLGDSPLPDRAAEDEFFEDDTNIRTAIWGGWAGGGHDSSRDGGAPTARSEPEPDPLEGKSFAVAVTRPHAGDVINVTDRPTRVVAGHAVFPGAAAIGTPTRFFFHRVGGQTCADGRYYLDRTNSDGDRETACQFGPANPALAVLGFPNTEPYAVDGSELPVALGTGTVEGTVVLTPSTPASPVQSLEIRLLSGETVLGTTTVTNPAVTADTPFDFSIAVPDDIVGVALPNLTVEVIQDVGASPARTELDGPSVSYVDLPIAEVPLERVQLTVDDPGFTTPSPAVLSGGRFATDVDFSVLPDGPHTLYARALQGDSVSESFTVPFTVERSATSAPPDAPSKVQVHVHEDEHTKGTAWIDAVDTSGRGDFSSWSASVPLGDLPDGSYQVLVRVLDDNGNIVARDEVTFELRRRR